MVNEQIDQSAKICYNPIWRTTPHAKVARKILKFATHYEMESIIHSLQWKGTIFPEDELEQIIERDLTNKNAVQGIKEYLIKTNAVSVVFNDDKEREDNLEKRYVSNLTVNGTVNNRVFTVLKSELLRHLPFYKNITSSGINVNSLKKDYSSYLHRGRSYEIAKAQIRKGVVIASIFDALLSRRSLIDTSIWPYFKDELKGKYYLISGGAARECDSIMDEMRLMVRTMKRYVACDELDKPIESEVLDDKSRIWGEVYKTLSRNPATYTLRQSLATTMDTFFNTNIGISHEQFLDYVNDLADIFMNTFAMEKLLEKDYKVRIIKIIQYIYLNNQNICTAIREGLSKKVKEEESALVDLFVYWVVEISLKIHKDILNRIITRYNHFYYLFIRSYCAYKRIKNTSSLESYFTIVKNLFYIKHSDDRLVKEVLTRNPSI